MAIYTELSLDGTWDLRAEGLVCGISDAERIGSSAEGWLAAPVPGDIHQALIAAGTIPEPLVGMNSFACRWTEERSWWYRRTIRVLPEWLESDRIELEFNGLDSNAQVFINGKFAGEHHNTFRPWVQDVRSLLCSGENVLLVRLTSGVETVTELEADGLHGVRASTETGNGRPERGDIRRTLVRKPQYSFGWDWSPRLATTAIAGGVVLRLFRTACIRQLEIHPQRPETRSSDPFRADVQLNVTAVVDWLHYYQTGLGKVTVVLTGPDGRVFQGEKQVLLKSGTNYIDLPVVIAGAELWWPNGLGPQHLYEVRAVLTVGGEQMELRPFMYGIRFVEWRDQGEFALVINGQKVFCKGADWIPADALYARISDEKYVQLVQEAQAANFNMLRIWGGGLYEKPAFYEACDRLGIMLWHDFMFACAPYPDHLEWFRSEVAQEADYQTKRLARHASIVLWCGNNENHWGFRDWWKDRSQEGAWIYNYLLPEIVRRNCPDVPYWNSSPYGGKAPNAYDTGDCHFWNEGMMNPEMDRRITPEVYDACTALFVSEYGYVGACNYPTVMEYMGDEPAVPDSPAWGHHTNTFEKNTVAAGIARHYRNPAGLSLRDYLLYSGLTQGLMYGYSLESLRANPGCSGGLFWMYADCWGEVGWTIVDYYLRRKPSWYFVRRAFAPVRIILRKQGQGQAVVLVINDRMEDQVLRLEVGKISMNGNSADLETVEFTVPGLSRVQAAVVQWDVEEAKSNLWVARPAGGGPDLLPGILRAADFRQMELPEADLRWTILSERDGQVEVEISSSVYAHAVHFSDLIDAQASDLYFDLLPGEKRRITVFSKSAAGNEIRFRAVNSPQ